MKAILTLDNGAKIAAGIFRSLADFQEEWNEEHDIEFKEL